MNPNSAFLRQWRMMCYIGSRPDGVTYRELADKFQVSTKTVRRDIELLAMVPNCPEVSGPTRKQLRIYPNSNSNEFQLSLRHDELFAFYLGSRLMEPLRGTNFWDSLQSGMTKIKKYLKSSVIDYAERISPMFCQMEPRPFRYAGKRELIDLLLQAMEDDNRVMINYRSVRAEKTKQYKIDPYCFLYHQGFIYIVGFSRKDKEIRFWKLDRLSNVDLLSKKFERPKDFSVEDYLSAAIVPFVYEEGREKILLRFKKSIVRYFHELSVAGIKNMTEEDDGSLLVEMEVEGGKPLIQWLLGFGSDVEVLQPESFRAAFREKVREIFSKYG